MVDVATVNAVSTAVTAQSSAGTPATIDAAFGALLQTMTGASDPSGMPAALPVAAPATTTLPVTHFAAGTPFQIPDATKSVPAATQPVTPATASIGAPGATTKPVTDFAAAAPFPNTDATDGGPVAAPPAISPFIAPGATTKPVTDFAAAAQPQSLNATGTTTVAMGVRPVTPAWFLAATSVVQVMTSTARDAPTGGTNDNVADATDDSAADSTANSATNSAANSGPGFNAMWQQTPPVMNTGSTRPPPPTTGPIDNIAAADVTSGVAPTAPQTAGYNGEVPTDARNQAAAVPANDLSLATLQTPGVPDNSTTPSTVPAQTSSNQFASDPAAVVEAARNMTAALAAAQAMAPPRGVESGTAEPKVKAQVQADAKPSSGKSKSVAFEKTSGAATGTDKTGANKVPDATTADAVTGGKYQPVQPAQDGQAQAGQSLNQPSQSAAAPQNAHASLPDNASQPAATAKTDAIAPPPVPAAPVAVQPPKVAAELQVAARHQNDDTVTNLDKLGVTIAAKSLQGLHEFNIRLDPVDLGRVQIKLTVDDAGQAQASLVVDKPQTLDLLQRDSASLNRVLTDAGLNLSNNGLNFSLREQQRQNDGGTDRGRSRSLSLKAAMAADSNAIHSTSGSYAPNSVRLDIRV